MVHKINFSLLPSFFVSPDKVNDVIGVIESLGCKYSHTAMKRGYHTVKFVTVRPYNGRYGEGYTVESHNPNSTRYCCISYYIRGGVKK